ncbi:8467_t:CDS:2 [Entrophospora sp. SA101]|nr:8467_t:CDS:2 [Entrophospora sp. SA101]
MGRIHKKYYSANATFLSDEAIQEIKGSPVVVNVVVPLLRAGLGNLPNGYICLSTAERQSLATRLEEI